MQQDSTRKETDQKILENEKKKIAVKREVKFADMYGADKKNLPE